jgi:hypothetical protein
MTPAKKPKCEHFGDYCLDVDSIHDCKVVTKCFLTHLERIRRKDREAQDASE